MSMMKQLGRVAAFAALTLAGAAHASNDPVMDAQVMRINKE